MAERDDSPEALAHALVQRVFELLHECRAILLKLEVPHAGSESARAQAERLLYFALLGALEARLPHHGGRGHGFETGQPTPWADGGRVDGDAGTSSQTIQAGGRWSRSD
jgi:hypothetical protein